MGSVERRGIEGEGGVLAWFGLRNIHAKFSQVNSVSCGVWDMSPANSLRDFAMFS